MRDQHDFCPTTLFALFKVRHRYSQKPTELRLAGVYLKASVLPVKAPVRVWHFECFQGLLWFCCSSASEVTNWRQFGYANFQKDKNQSSYSSFIAGIGISEVAETEDLFLCVKQIHTG